MIISAIIKAVTQIVTGGMKTYAQVAPVRIWGQTERFKSSQRGSSSRELVRILPVVALAIVLAIILGKEK